MPVCAAGSSRRWAPAGWWCSRRRVRWRPVLRDWMILEMPPDSTRLKPGWATVTLLLLVQIAVVVRFRESAWLGDTRRVLVMMPAAATYGLGLALSRFRTRTALAFNLVMALGLGAIVMGRLLPGLTDMVSRPSSATLWVVHGGQVSLRPG